MLPPSSGSEKGSFGKGVFSEKSHFLEILEILENTQTVENKGESDHCLEILEILENTQTVENKGESDHCLEILETIENLEILEIPSMKRPLP